MVFFGVVFQREVLRALVQILQAQQGANPLVEWELVADHNVGVATGVEPSIAEKTGKIKPLTAVGSSNQCESAICGKPEITKVQWHYLFFQRVKVTVIVDDVVGPAKPLLSGSLGCND